MEWNHFGAHSRRISIAEQARRDAIVAARKDAMPKRTTRACTSHSRIVSPIAARVSAFREIDIPGTLFIFPVHVRR